VKKSILTFGILLIELLALSVSAPFLARAQPSPFTHAATFPRFRVVGITDYSPGAGPFANESVYGASLARNSISGRMTAVAVSANGQRLYAASERTGLWRSSDGGATWCQLTNRIPCVDAVGANPVTLFAPQGGKITDIAIAPDPPNGALVLVTTAFENRTPLRSGVYRSPDGGATWHRVHEFNCGGQTSPALQVRFAPDPGNSSAVFAAGGCTVARSHDGGQTWTDVSPGSALGIGDVSITFIAVSELDPSTGHHWVYACASGSAIPFFYSSDDGAHWRDGTRDGSFPSSGCDFQAPNTAPANNRNSSPHLIAVEPGAPGRVFLAVLGTSNGPRFFDPGPDKTFGTPDDVPAGWVCNTNLPSPPFPPNTRLGCGEAGLWYGNLRARPGSARWGLLSSPPNYFGSGSPSGSPFVITQPKLGGYFLFFGDVSSTNMHDGLPPTTPQNAGWHHLDGYDVWSCVPNCPSGAGGSLIHPDPYDLVVSADFNVTLSLPAPSCASPPANQQNYCWNSTATNAQGRIWMANDGGIYTSTYAGNSGSWTAARVGLSTLGFNGAAVTARAGGPGVGIYTGMGDNSSLELDPDLPNPDLGPQWRVPDDCGDCSAYFGDAVRPDRVVHVDQNRLNQFGVFISGSLAYPDTAVCAPPRVCFNVAYPTPPDWQDARGPAWGNLPVIQTLSGEASPPAIDLVKIMPYVDDVTNQTRYRLYRYSGGPGAAWQQIGPDLPNSSQVVQTAGGHTIPTYYIQTANGRLFKSQYNGSSVSRWQPLVNLSDSSRTLCVAQRFFVDPYTSNPNAQRLYADDPGTAGCPAGAGIKVSTDGGVTWSVDSSLDSVVTQNNHYSHVCNLAGCLLNAFTFQPVGRQIRFAQGSTGVYATVDGRHWTTILADRVLPCAPTAAVYDTLVTGQASLYVFCSGRSMLKVDLVIDNA
jgi:hypothetical protein